MIIAPLPQRDQVEIDRDEHYWCLTYGFDDLFLRVRIAHSGDMDPDEFIFEARPREAAEFAQVGSCLVAPIEHSAEWAELPDVSVLPELWRGEFLMLVRLWSHLTDCAGMAPALGTIGPTPGDHDL